MARSHGGGRRRGRRKRNNNGASNENQSTATIAPEDIGPVTIPPAISVGDLADILQHTPVEVIRELMGIGVMATINQQVDFDVAVKVAEQFGIEAYSREDEGEDESAQQGEVQAAIEESAADPRAKLRPPIVTILGHVDHGKTKLLDAIRKARIEGTEAGGITQRIGAYQVDVDKRKITFIDTPGHEAFAAMRARGAKITDIAVLVVAADDGVMPQTREAISHAKAADVPIIVAINKMDLPSANPDYVKQQLAEAEVVPEEYGGDVPVVELSAKAMTGIDDLLEMILLVSDIQELKANPHTQAVGVVIEAELERSRGVAASLLVRSGTLQLRDIVVAGSTYGRIRAMEDDRGKSIRRVGPSSPAVVFGLFDLPEAGDAFQVVEDEKRAREIAEERKRQQRDEMNQTRVNLDQFYTQLEEGEAKELPIVLKAESQGSLGAAQASMAKLAENVDEVALTIVHTGTGAITESDVNLAVASGAIIIGFNVRPDPASRRLAERENIDIRFYDVIYHLTEDIQQAMTGMLEPEQREITDGYAEVRDTFRLPNRVVVAGCYVTDGKIQRNSRARVLRSGAVIGDTTFASLKRFKDDVREVQSGYECGMTLDGFNDFEEGDLIEAYHIEEIARG